MSLRILARCSVGTSALPLKYLSSHLPTSGDVKSASEESVSDKHLLQADGSVRESALVCQERGMRTGFIP